MLRNALKLCHFSLSLLNPENRPLFVSETGFHRLGTVGSVVPFMVFKISDRIKMRVKTDA
ncbi:hypothetical protein CES85_0663 [Ochrobactrum quorumnocens]|uniref:Uncharacterized protein n=1 Tax=Ochrobactrum quorumnocens TaxID=271865 RepID=A0A248UGA1_9HYPH|nr:hypothetical protein CES85_0663 [[Ochrobactrum] quorumnocens]